MTTVWRPRVRIDVPDVGDVENKDTSREESTKKGTKRKIAPKHFGPCEHGVKYRSSCKVCVLVRTVVGALSARSAVGHAICEHGRQALSSARSAVGHDMRARSSALSCKECGGASICEHGRRRSKCKECGGSSICEHGRQRSQCKECGGSSICEHGRRRCKCKECGGASICEHGRERSQCKECGGSQSASTVVGALNARSAVGINLRARSSAL